MSAETKGYIGLMVVIGIFVCAFSFLAGAVFQYHMPPGATQGWIDQRARRQIFMSCLTNLPTGPTHVESDTWDKVVLACDTIAEREAQAEKPCDGCVKR